MNIFSLVPHNLPLTPSLQFKGITAILIFSLTLTMGCNKYIKRSFQPVNLESYEAVRHWPPEGVEITTQIGESMMKTLIVPILPAMELQDPIVHITDYRDNLKMKLEADHGILELVGTDGVGGRYYATSGGLRLSYESDTGFTDLEVLHGGIHVATSGAKSMYWLWEGVGYASMVPAPSFQYTMSTAEYSSQNARFNRELVYSGTAQSTLSILYREFIDNMARPAFSQDLKYDLNHGNIIGYKNARFDVLNVGNTSITYKVIAPLKLDAEISIQDLNE